MNNKKIIAGLSALIIVLAIFIVSEKLGDKKPSENEVKFFPGLDDKSISSLVIKEGTNSVKLSRKGEEWMVSKVADTTDSNSIKEKSYKADSASVQIALEKLTSMKKGDLISENPQNQPTFQVDSLSGTFVEIWKGDDASAGAIRIGKNGPDWNSNYVRKLGSNSVFTVPGGLRYSLFSELDRWRDKKIMKFESSAAQKIELVKKEGSITIEKADSGWVLTQPIQHKASADKVNEIINTLSALKAAEFVYETPSDTASGMNSPALLATVSLNGGAERKVVIGKTKGESNLYWTKVEGNEEFFLIGKSDMDKIDVDAESLKAVEDSTSKATEAK